MDGDSMGDPKVSSSQYLSGAQLPTPMLQEFGCGVLGTSITARFSLCLVRTFLHS